MVASAYKCVDPLYGGLPISGAGFHIVSYPKMSARSVDNIVYIGTLPYSRLVPEPVIAVRASPPPSLTHIADQIPKAASIANGLILSYTPITGATLQHRWLQLLYRTQILCKNSDSRHFCCYSDFVPESYTITGIQGFTPLASVTLATVSALSLLNINPVPPPAQLRLRRYERILLWTRIP